jgi:phosphoribosylformylglycinamidine synthase
MRFGVVVFPGSNCDRDCRDVTERLLGQPTVFIWHEADRLPDLDVVILPGGFSYGDALRAGAIARFSPVMKAVSDFAQQGGYVLGICNGFQILVESGLLPGAFRRNRQLKFICKQVPVRVENNHTPFTVLYTAGQVLSLPIAHAEGNYYIDDAGLEELREAGRILFRYGSASGTPSDNPNGAVDDIAGICNATGNVLGMMPHPERASEALLGGTDGVDLFRSLVASLPT